jgi:propanediol dehydratase small subunit
MNGVAVLAVILVVSIGGWLLAERLQFRSYWRRSCTGRAWKLGYPKASKAEIREFLKLFVRVFGFRESRMLRFEPTDQVKDILSKRSPSHLSPDPLEMGDFARLARERYGVDLASAWHDGITLGEVFEKTQRRVA